MLPAVCVLDDDLDDVEVVEHEALRAVRARDRRVLAERELGQDRGDERGVVRDVVDDRVVGAVVHRVELELERDRARRGLLRDDHERDEVDVVHVVVQVDGPRRHERRGRAVRDRRCQVYVRGSEYDGAAREKRMYCRPGHLG